MLHLGQGNPVVVQPGWWTHWEQQHQERLYNTDKLKPGISNMHLQPKKPTISWTAQTKRRQQTEGGDSHFLLLQKSTISTASSPGTAAPEIQSCQRKPRGGAQEWSEGCNASPVRKGWEIGACSVWRRFSWDITVTLQSLKWACRTDRMRLFARACSNKT